MVCMIASRTRRVKRFFTGGPMDQQDERAGHEKLDRMFNPKSIAIVGVTSGGFSFGRSILLSHLAIGYEGALYPVNTRGGRPKA